MGLKANIRTVKAVSASIGGRDTTPAKWKGEWQEGETYAALEKVSREGSSFVCVKACIGVDPALDVGEGVEGKCWILIAKRGEAFTYDMFTAAQLEALRGRPFTYEDFTPAQIEALRGKAFTYADFTTAQLEALRGKAFTYEDFTSEQLEALRGKPFTYADFTTAQLEALRGAAFTYEDFTSEQLTALKGAQGVGIRKIEQTGGGAITDQETGAVSARWKEYRITYTDGSTFDYRVEGGADGPRGLRGLAFTYNDFTAEQLEALKGRAFTYEDFTAAQLEALRGPRGDTITDISRTAGNGAPGTIDTYTVTTNTGKTWPLYLYNGKDGEGAGDMTAAVYDRQEKKTDVFDYVDQKVANIPTPDVSKQISDHNAATDAHNDIRLLVTELTNRLNALANSEDVDLDQMAELVAYIKDNRELIDQITTGKVSVADIINNLTTNIANKPLSAAQGVALKTLADAAASAASAAQSTADTAKTNAATAQGRADAAYSLAEGKQSKITGQAGQVVGFDASGNPVAQEAPSGGGTTVIMAEREPDELGAGDDWDQILTELEAPREMFPYAVTLPSGAGYTVSPTAGGGSVVYRGDDYSFTVTIADGYEAGAGFAVKANGAVLTAVNGVYTIENITADQTVTVEGVAASVAVVTITGTGNTTYCYATINGTKRYGAASNIQVKPGDTITFGVYGRSTSYVGQVTIDGSEALSVTNQTTQTYNWTVPAGTKTINIAMSYTSSTYQRRGTITVTTTK